MIDAVLSWPALLTALVVFGFAPGALLRLIVRAFEREDPRRRELLAELYAVPRMERPFWVLEQLEVALFEGVWERMRWAATGRVIDRWHVRSAVELNRVHPQTFWIPAAEERLAVAPGWIVQLPFAMTDGWAERMWVEVTAVQRRHLVGKLRNEPVGIPRLARGDEIKFKRDHIMNISSRDEISNRVMGAAGWVPMCEGCNPTPGFDSAERLHEY
jgi:hypothetical protein